MSGHASSFFRKKQDEECIDDGSGKGAGTGAFEDEKTWVSVDVHQAVPAVKRCFSSSSRPDVFH